MNLPPHSLYLHIPFCQARCSYCDFNAYAGLHHLMQAYTQALCLEMTQVAARHGAPQRIPIHTIFLGGGTPSLLPLEQIAQILATARQSFDILPDCEVTIEANPGTIDLAYLQGLRAAGINRLSLGVQSAQPAELLLLERIHSFPVAQQAVAWAREAGFGNISIDLMFGLPGQSMESWRATLESVAAMQPHHLSLYALTLEPETPMYHRVQRGDLKEIDSDLAAELYEEAGKFLTGLGNLAQYEISNWASLGAQCRHNLQYWRNLPYLGFGAGAHGFAAQTRYSVIKTPSQYIRRMKDARDCPFPLSSASVESEVVSEETARKDTMLLGLRLTEEGVNFQEFHTRHGIDLRDCFARELSRLHARTLIEYTPDRVRLTVAGRLLANIVFREFV